MQVGLATPISAWGVLQFWSEELGGEVRMLRENEEAARLSRKPLGPCSVWCRYRQRRVVWSSTETEHMGALPDGSEDRLCQVAA